MLVLGLPGAMPAMAAEGDADAVAIATRLLDHMQAGEYEAATADFTAQMKGGLGVETLAAVQAQLAAAGAETGRGEPEVSLQSALTVAVTRIHTPHADHTAPPEHSKKPG